jgi:hypothetical protein
MPSEPMVDYLARLKAEGRPSPFDPAPPGVSETQAQYAARKAAEAEAEAKAEQDAERKAVERAENKAAK